MRSSPDSNSLCLFLVTSILSLSFCLYLPCSVTVAKIGNWKAFHMAVEAALNYLETAHQNGWTQTTGSLHPMIPKHNIPPMAQTGDRCHRLGQDGVSICEGGEAGSTLAAICDSDSLSCDYR